MITLDFDSPGAKVLGLTKQEIVMPVTVEDLYRAYYGYHEGTAVMQAERARVFQEFDALKLDQIELKLTTSEGEEITAKVDCSRAVWSQYSLVDYPFSPSFKNYTIRKGTKSRKRVFVELPKPGVIKTLPEYQEWMKQKAEWADARLKAAHDAAQAKMIEQMAAEHPEFQEILDLKDEDVRGYLEAKGWNIPQGLSFENWRPCGWILTSGPDGFGHQCGSYADVDWANKTIQITGFSSDD
jgi:hypothetical protein